MRLAHHSAEADARYEQCPWDREHVEEIYPVLRGEILADGSWHPVPVPGGVARYRVDRGSYFQVVYAEVENPVFTALLTLDAVETDDDAEWSVWSLQEGGYALTSTFAVTPGPMDHQASVNAWLWRHGLRLEPKTTHAEGAALFMEMDSGSVRDAIERLAWLEHVIRDLWLEYDSTGTRFWERLKPASDRATRDSGLPEETDEIIPVPSERSWLGGKRRLPVPQDS